MSLASEHRSSFRSPPDFCSKDGAEALKEKLETYWRERGHAVMIVLHEAGFSPVVRTTRFDVRSDMKNGKPAK